MRTARIQTDLKDSIEKCQKKWDGLEKKLSRSVVVDTNIRAQRMEEGLQDMEDRQLGIAELGFFSMINENNSFNSPSGEDSKVAIPTRQLQKSD